MKRFFYHYRRQTGGMTVHFDKRCIPVTNVRCLVPSETKHRPRQPRLVMQGYAQAVEIQGDTAVIR